MPIIRYDNVEMQDVTMEGVAAVTKANVIGPSEGWEGYTLRVFRIAPGGYAPHHKHDWEHINYVIKGKGTLTIGDTTSVISEKDFAFVPANTVHQFRNPNDKDFEFICIVPNKGA